MGLGTSILLIANRFCIELVYSECLCINIYQIDQDVYTHLEGFILICSQTDGFGYLFCAGANSYGLPSSFCVIFVSFLAAFAIKLISGGNKKILLIASGNGFQLFP